jgi:uncharacterized protein
VVDIHFNEISEKLKTFDFPPFDIVVGIARGGVVPAMLIAHQFGSEFKLLTFNYRDDSNTPRYEEPVFLSGTVEDLPIDKKILLVDDVSVTGKTLDAVKKHLPKHNIATFVLKGKADYVLITDINECVNWPWKNKI